MSKRKKKLHRVEIARRKLGCTLDTLFQRAAEWIKEVYGQHIGKGAVLRAKTDYHRRSKEREWLTKFLDHFFNQPVHAF